MSSKRSFTIVEMLIVVALFSVVMIAITGSIELFFASTLSERSKSRAISSVEFAIEEMKREISHGRRFGFEATATANEDIDSGYPGVRFINQFGTLVEYVVIDSDNDGFGGLYGRLCHNIKRENDGTLAYDRDGLLICRDDKWSESLLTLESVEINAAPFFLDNETNPRANPRPRPGNNAQHNLRLVIRFTVRYTDGTGGQSYIPSALSEDDRIQVQITRLSF